MAKLGVEEQELEKFWDGPVDRVKGSKVCELHACVCFMKIPVRILDGISPVGREDLDLISEPCERITHTCNLVPVGTLTREADVCAVSDVHRALS